MVHMIWTISNRLYDIDHINESPGPALQGSTEISFGQWKSTTSGPCIPVNFKIEEFIIWFPVLKNAVWPLQFSKKCVLSRIYKVHLYMAPFLIAIIVRLSAFDMLWLCGFGYCRFIGYRSEAMTLYERTRKLVCLWLSFMSLASSIWFD